jgi:hypothetical protein
MDQAKGLLAEEPGLGKIQLCGCHSIHLSIGPVTLNLAPEAFAQMATMVHKAMEELADIVRSTDDDSDPLKTFEPQRSRFTN